MTYITMCEGLGPAGFLDVTDLGQDNETSIKYLMSSI